MRKPSQECEKSGTHEQDKVARIKVSFVKYGIATVTSATSKKRRYSIGTYIQKDKDTGEGHECHKGGNNTLCCLAIHLY